MLKKTGISTFLLLTCLFVSSSGFAAMDALLNQIWQARATLGVSAAQSYAEHMGIQVRVDAGQVQVPVIIERKLINRPGFTTRIKLIGARLDAMSLSYGRILVPIESLSLLASIFPSDLLRTPYPLHETLGKGNFISESVSLTGSDGYQVGSFDGTGVKVAVVDLGFTGLSAAISAGELPSNTISMDFSGTGIEANTQHGTGIAEHVVDMAPGVELHCLKISDEVDLQNAAAYIASNNISIANLSVAWALASYYDDTGTINNIINNSRDNDGVFWTVPSGNFAQQHWRGTWQDADNDNSLEFATGDEFMALSGGNGIATVFLNWDQYGASSKTNLDLFIVDKTGNLVTASQVAQSSFTDPAEAVSFTYDSSQAPYSIQVKRISGSTNNLDITLFSFSHNFEYAIAASSTPDPANAHGAYTVGAINQSNWQQIPPPLESFSGRGPTNDGRTKPDIVSPDGTSSLTYGNQGSFGTSFSSATVAGAAALLKHENNIRTAANLESLLSNNTIDVGTPGVDPDYGHGKLQLPPLDTDGDGLSNATEISIGTDHLNPDTDGDGLNDFEENQTYGTNPLLQDSDSDGLTDFDEVITFGTDPLTSNKGDLAPRGAPDGNLNAADYLILSRLVSGVITPTTTEMILGDLNTNTGLDAGDLVLHMRIILGLMPPP